ncbi:MAG: hypothetical protein SVM80_10170 [Halobacteriota archaeon]|nr:hypothetical protein [Halobacteriota archaeon]
MDEQIINLLKKIFAQSEYRTEPSYEFDLLAEKDREQVYVRYIEFPDQEGVRNFASQTRDRAGIPLIVSKNYFSNETRRLADEYQISMWNRDEFEMQIGRALLASLEGKITDLSFTKKDLQTYDFPFMDFMATPETEQSESPLPFVPVEPVEPVKPVEPVEIKLSTLPIKVDRSDALAISKREIRNPEISKLRFIPIWKYEYSLDIKKRYRSKDIDMSGDGLGEINALTGLTTNICSIAEELCDRVTIKDGKYVVEKPVISKEEAESMAMEDIVSKYSQAIKFSDIEGQAIVYEDKTFRPEPDDITLNSELIYLPIWEIKGPNGFFEVNAVNGEEIDYPLDDDAEFV